MTAKMAPRWPNTCYISSAILEICLQALRLATLSALPVPMLRQVYLQGLEGPENGDFAKDILKKWAHGHVSSMLRCRLFFKKPSWAILGPSWAYLGPSWGHLGPSWGHLGPSWGHLGPSWDHLGPSWGSIALRIEGSLCALVI